MYCGEELSNNNVPTESLSGVTYAKHSEKVCMSESSTQTPPRPIMSIDDFINDYERMLFYTGLASHTDFHFVLHSLGPAAYHFRYLYNPVQNVSVESQFFSTLMKLRQNKTNYELGRMFGISKTTVDNIWFTWANFLARQLRDITLWPHSGTVNFFSPCDLYNKFPSTRVIIDCTEIPLNKKQTFCCSNVYIFYIQKQKYC